MEQTVEKDNLKLDKVASGDDPNSSYRLTGGRLRGTHQGLSCISRDSLDRDRQEPQSFGSLPLNPLSPEQARALVPLPSHACATARQRRKEMVAYESSRSWPLVSNALNVEAI